MQTKTRRLLQPIWNAFDSYLGPFSEKGVVLCVSGGSDSRALMEAVALWPRRFANIQVVSVDHGTRPEALAESLAVCARARVLGFDAQQISLEPGKNDEASLRKRRYEAIQGDPLVTAHTQDDQAESFIMDLMGLGGGPEGAGMLPVSESPPLKKGGQGGFIIRPLLDFSRAYLIGLLTELGIYDYVNDPTNEYSTGKRVGVRQFLALHHMPKERLAELAQRRRQDLEALKLTASGLLELTGDTIRVTLAKNHPEPVKFQALKLGLRELLPEADLRGADNTLRQIAKQALPRQKFHLPGAIGYVASIQPPQRP